MEVDFGVGAVVQADGTARGICGTPACMAPEVLRDGVSTIASDLYSVGVLLFYLVTGCLPGEDSLVIGEAARRPNGASRLLEDHRPGLPPDFIAVIEKAMDPDPSRRFGSAGEMLRALQAGGNARIRAVDRPTDGSPRRFLTRMLNAFHVAVATVHGMDYLLSWNCAHIANATMRGTIEAICRAAGFAPPVICTPLELCQE